MFKFDDSAPHNLHPGPTFRAGVQDIKGVVVGVMDVYVARLIFILETRVYCT